MKTRITLGFLLLLTACSRTPNTSLAVVTDKTAGQLTATTQIQEPRAGHTATLLKNGKVLLAGGMERNDVFTASAELFTPATGAVTPTKTPMSAKRVGHTATLLPDGKVLLTGGWAGGWNCEASADLYDPTTNSFTRLDSMQQGRADHSATLLNDGRVLIAGGAQGREQLQSCELFDPQTATFSPAPALLSTPVTFALYLEFAAASYFYHAVSSSPFLCLCTDES